MFVYEFFFLLIKELLFLRKLSSDYFVVWTDTGTLVAPGSTVVLTTFLDYLQHSLLHSILILFYKQQHFTRLLEMASAKVSYVQSPDRSTNWSRPAASSTAQLPTPSRVQAIAYLDGRNTTNSVAFNQGVPSSSWALQPIVSRSGNQGVPSSSWALNRTVGWRRVAGQ